MADIDLRENEEMDFYEDDENQVEKLKESVKTRKGRGFGEETRIPEGGFDSMEVGETQADKDGGPQRSIEGWIVFATGIQDEATADDVSEKFEEFGQIKNLKLPIDSRTGYVKGYALVEYETYKEADSAIKAMNGSEICGQTIAVDWAFVKGPTKKAAQTDRRTDRRRGVNTSNRGDRPTYRHRDDDRRNGRRDNRRSPSRRGRNSF